VTVGVLVMAYGTPRDRDDIEAYYTDIRRGRPPTPEQLADLVARYDAVSATSTSAAGGGAFPLRAATEQQCDALAAALDAVDPDGFVVAIGTRHSTPSIEEGVRQLVAAGVSRLVGLVLAPHFSRMSIGAYADRVAKAAAESGVDVDVIESWHLLPSYLSFLADAVRDALQHVPTGSEVVFTAHSLPARIVDDGDPYPLQLAETAAAVARLLGLDNWSVGWQSAGRTPEPWLGPDVLEVIRDRADRGVVGVVVCPCGFVADHLEVAYDLDIEAARLAHSVGLPFARTATVGAAPEVFAALADVVASR
jgi:protoporphyrin/coproporphyrin ferrochelatase